MAELSKLSESQANKLKKMNKTTKSARTKVYSVNAFKGGVKVGGSEDTSDS